MATTEAKVNDKREIFGWAMYDWANSAFSTTIGTVFLGPYVASLAATAAKGDPSGLARIGGIGVAPDSFFPYCVSISVVLQVLFLPIVGAIADYSHIRKQLMQVFASLGAAMTILMFVVTGSLWWLGGLLFILANLAFGASIVLYNSYLPDIASEDQRDRVSSYGWAMGYLGDGILLALNLAFYTFRDRLGIPTELAIRVNLASAGVWWLTFSFFTWARLHPRHARKPLPEGETYTSVGFKQLGQTMREIGHFPETLKFLGAYFLYNDGIQTVIAVSSTFAAAPLLRGGLELDISTLTAIILLIQFTAFFGALFWGRLASWVGAKRAIIISLTIWACVVTYAYFGMRSAQVLEFTVLGMVITIAVRVLEFAVLGVVIAIVLGGSQAISRSLFAQMIPQGKEAEFYSFYEVSDRGTSWIGPLLFGLVNQIAGNLRPAIFSLIFFFVVGLIALPFVNEKKAIEDAKKYEGRQVVAPSPEPAD